MYRTGTLRTLSCKLHITYYLLHTCTYGGGMCVVPVPGTRVLWVHRTVHHQRRGACYKGYLS